MTVAQRPNVSQRGREKLARLGSLDLATEFSMWNESKQPAIGGLLTFSSAFVDLLQLAFLYLTVLKAFMLTVEVNVC